LSDRISAEKLLPTNSNLWRYTSVNGEMKPKRVYSFCARVAYSATIAYDGTVLPCCFDAKAEFDIGNVLTTSWSEIWNGTKFEVFRKSVMKRGGYKPEICSNCTEGLRRLYIPTKTVLKSTSMQSDSSKNSTMAPQQ